ncbi:class I SAM-dependent methyltransferase [Aurantibacillus circumpalustris]|uniref:class I SAM-dependent methyltransferase n=1 Tax=Aurantibacillus circumpalustris TaxID=3036359 RepID=UPI00295C35A4|nr:class I SAM-dependent methyltransferase [Aurantibacillus circumpalustris]
MSTLSFNSYAKDYDKHFTNSPIGILQRKRVYKYLLPLLSKQKKVLEINCGTGEDAIYIAQKVKSVLATDISSEMIREGQAKKNKNNLDNVIFEISDINELHTKLSSSFDLLFSDFGGLNCLSGEELKKFSTNISSSISNRGHLALVIMGKKCFWENFFYLWQGDKRYKRRNTKQGQKTEINGAQFLTYYHSPKEISSVFFKDFRTIKIRPIGLFVPPSYLNTYFANKPILLQALNICERIFANFALFANFADHYFILLQKKSLTE